MIFRHKFLYLTSTKIRDFFEGPNSTDQSQQTGLEEAVRLQEIRHQQEQQIDPWLLACASRSNRSKERQVTVCTHCKQPNMLFHGLSILLHSGRLVLRHAQDKRPQHLEENLELGDDNERISKLPIMWNLHR